MYTVIDINPVYEVQHEDMASCPLYLDSDARISICRCITNLYKSGKLPTFSDVYEIVKDMIPNILTYSQFEYDMTLLGYVYKKMPFGHILMENPEITFERYFYLKNMINHRQKKQNIYYIDQRIIDNTLIFRKPSLENTDGSIRTLDDTLVFLYAISATTGEVNGFFTNIFDPANFSKWIADIVSCSFKPNSVVVIDNNFKRILSQKEITMYNNKDHILKWLKRNGIPCSSNMRKAELFELYRKSLKNNIISNVSSIFEACGHRVLYLPSNLLDLSPTNFLWEDISRVLRLEEPDYLASNNSGGVSNLITKISALTMPVTASNFLEFDEVIALREKQIFDLDAETEEYLDNIIQMSPINENISLLVKPEQNTHE